PPTRRHCNFCLKQLRLDSRDNGDRYFVLESEDVRQVTLEPVRPKVRARHRKRRPRSRQARVYQAWPLRTEISSMPITTGEGSPAAASCARMYCFSSVLTVCQSSASSRPMSRTEARRQRAPTSMAKRSV